MGVAGMRKMEGKAHAQNCDLLQFWYLVLTLAPVAPLLHRAFSSDARNPKYKFSLYQLLFDWIDIGLRVVARFM